MEQVRLGKSGLSVSRLALGTWQFGGDWGSADEHAVTTTIRRARELGINLFDTAQAYGWGASERLLGRALRDELRHHREDVVIATKGGMRPEASGLRWDSSARWLRLSVEGSLRALGIDYIDLYQLHWPDPRTPSAESAQVLKDMVDEGKIRYVGVSNFDVAQIEQFAAETLQVPYNLFHRNIEKKILPYCADHDVGVLAYGPLAHSLLGGHLRPDSKFHDWRGRSPMFSGDIYRHNLKAVNRLAQFAQAELNCSVSQLAIAWVLANPSVHVAIVGCRRPEQVTTAAYATDVHLGKADKARVDAIMAKAAPIGVPSPGAT
jgi:aryl-alcohol dehydrogenase-like predicted oxidoreductase